MKAEFKRLNEQITGVRDTPSPAEAGKPIAEVTSGPWGMSAGDRREFVDGWRRLGISDEAIAELDNPNYRDPAEMIETTKRRKADLPWHRGVAPACKQRRRRCDFAPIVPLAHLLLRIRSKPFLSKGYRRCN